MKKTSVATYNFFRRYPVLLVISLCVLMVVAFINIRKIVFYDDFSAIFPQSEKFDVFNQVITNSGFLDQIVFNVHHDDAVREVDPGKLTYVAAQLIDSIEVYLKRDGYIRTISGRTSDMTFTGVFDAFYDNIPFYLDSADYLRFDTLLTYHGIKKQLEQNLRLFSSPVSFVSRDYLLADPLQIVFPKLDILRDLQMEENFESYNDFLITSDKRNVLFFVLPEDAHQTAQNEYIVATIERIKNNLERLHEPVRIDYYGSVPVAVANTRQIKQDIKTTLSVAFVLLVFLLFFFFRRILNVLLIFVPAAFGGMIALLIFGLFKNEVSAISLAIGSVLLGITIDFSLHFLTHQKHTGSSGKTLKAITEPVLMSGLTTTAAFLSLLFIASPALKDLGLFASLAVMGAAIGALVLLPHLVAKKRPANSQKLYRHTIVERIAAWEPEKNKILLFTILALSVFLLFFVKSTSFEEDIEKTGYLSEELAKADKRLKEISDLTETTVYVMSKGETLDQGLKRNEYVVRELNDLREKSVFDAYYSVARLIPSTPTQQQKIAVWNAYWTDEKLAEVKTLMRAAGGALGFNEKMYSGFFNMITREYQITSPDTLARALSPITDNFIIYTPDDVMVVNLIKATSDDVQSSVALALDDVFDTLVFDKKSITQNLFELLKNDFNRFINIALLLVFLIILLVFGRIELAIITFLPMALSWGWTIGIMGLFDIKFNLFNVIVSAFIFGLGIDYSIFITKGLLQKYKFDSRNIVSYKSSILVSCLSTLIGVGVLIFAKHPALQSIALISIIGISSVVVIAFTIQPLLFKLMFYNKGKPRKNPVNLYQLFVSSVGFFSFGLIALILSALVPVFHILPVKKEIKTKWYKHLICYSCKLIIWFFWRYTANTKNEINKHTFSEPSIVISNHQSVMDLLLFMSLTPKIILLVKTWVWNNFFFGRVVKYAGFILVDDNYQESVPAIGQALESGNSVLIFPEGTRTRSGKIRRFHKGAFFFAEQLKADITAILLHAYYDALPSGTFYIDRYPCSTHLLGRFRYDALENNYSARAKAMCKIYRSKYETLIHHKRGGSFYKQELLNKYKFIGPVIEFYVRIKLRLEKYYDIYDQLIPKNAKILDAGCGMGMLANMLSLTGKNRIIKGVDYDFDRIRIAKHTIADDQQNIVFECQDLKHYEPENYDVFILHDVLHYVSSENQKELIERFIKKLKPGGKIIIREGNKEVKNKHLVTRLSEFFSTKFGFNKTKAPLSFVSGSFIKKIATENNMMFDVKGFSKTTSNQIFVLSDK